MMTPIAIDTETVYSKDYSVADMSVNAYVADPRFNCYLISIVGGGIEFVGHPAEFNRWGEISGPGFEWCAHNVGFDKAVIEKLIETGVIPATAEPERWACTADLSAFLGAPRNLAGASAVLLDVEHTKDVRAKMTGKTPEMLSPDEIKDLHAYALKDAKLCYELHVRHGDKMPENERFLSEHTRQRAWEGVPVNRDKLKEAIRMVSAKRMAAEMSIPWFGGIDQNGDDIPVLSVKHLAAECRKYGIEPPPSLAQTSPECDEWLVKYGEQFPFIDAMRTYRSTNALLCKLKNMDSRTSEDGKLKAGLLYFGAAQTGRWSGSSKVNLQNLPRGELHGVDVRSIIEAPPGYTFVISDLSQIEPRCLGWLTGDTEFLEKVASVPLYQAYAESKLGWSGGNLKEEDPNMYRLSKACVLGAGYGAGASKFQLIAKLMAGLDLSPEQAAATIAQFRRANPKIVRLWREMDSLLDRSRNSNMDISLPSGRIMTYREIRRVGDVSAVICRSGRMIRTKLYGARIVENVTQGTARDVFAYHVQKIEESGIPVIWTVHDECIAMVPETVSRAAKAVIERVMSTPPPWMNGLPVACEAHISKVYSK